ncbi:hyaluronidase-like [Boleophthalmus pectinirostris]|uniref:hyaluronidase-like n=1 Tax=Boleophthalmus pectinirostris TaxID=150288 RepID=UPI0024331435|nr:hyaluronidase-like [Boleophthalmus pectinirostris]
MFPYSCVFELSQTNHDIPLNKSPFRGVAKGPSHFLSLFLSDRLRLNPHMDVNIAQQHNGGIPQRGNLKASKSVQSSLKKAQEDVAARSWMSTILAMGTALRPNYLWGFYLFPKYYNYDWEALQYTEAQR